MLRPLCRHAPLACAPPPHYRLEVDISGSGDRSGIPTPKREIEAPKGDQTAVTCARHRTVTSAHVDRERIHGESDARSFDARLFSDPKLEARLRRIPAGSDQCSLIGVEYPTDQALAEPTIPHLFHVQADLERRHTEQNMVARVRKIEMDAAPRLRPAEPELAGRQDVELDRCRRLARSLHPVRKDFRQIAQREQLGVRARILRFE